MPYLIAFIFPEVTLYPDTINTYRLLLLNEEQRDSAKPANKPNKPPADCLCCHLILTDNTSVMYITPITLYQVSATNPDPCFALPKVNSVQLTQARIPIDHY